MLVNKLTKDELQAKRAAVAKVVAKHNDSLLLFNEAMETAAYNFGDQIKRLRKGQLIQTAHVRKTAWLLTRALKEVRALMMEIRHECEQ